MDFADRDDRAEEAESKKQEQLKAVDKGTNEWTPELASDSENAVCFCSLFPPS